MSDRQLCALYLFVGFSASVALLIAAAFIPVTKPQLAPTRANPFGNPPGMVDRLVFLDQPEAWSAGTFAHSKIDADGKHITLTPDSDREYPRHGRWTSPELAADFPFTELIPSWNALVPPQAGVTVFVRVRDTRGGAWSPWLYFGGWGQSPAGEHPIRFEHGVVHIDNLVLDRPADAFQVRVEMASFTFDAEAAPRLRRIVVGYSGVVADDAKRERLAQPVKITGDWARSLDVPYRTQQDAPKSLRGQICSPTSTSMVLEYWGHDRPTVENAMAIYDAEHEQFGTWNRAVQRAGELGLDAWLARFRSWDAVKAQIALGRPVVASIRFGKGEMPAAALESTDGHLIVIRGFKRNGDVIVNDPANRKKGNGAVYPAEDLGRAWFGHGGVGYVISGPATNPSGKTLAGKLPVAHKSDSEPASNAKEPQ